MLLDALVRLGETPLESLAASTGVTSADADALVARLIALNYAERIAPAGPDASVAYRAITRGPAA
jgi:hypothetical protein